MGNIFRKRNSNSGGVASRSRSISAKDGSSSDVRRSEEVKTTTSGSRLPSRPFSSSFSAHFHASSSLSEIPSSSSKTSTAAIRTEKSSTPPGYESKTNKYNFIPDNFSSLDQVSSSSFFSFFLPARVPCMFNFCPANMKCC